MPSPIPATPFFRHRAGWRAPISGAAWLLIAALGPDPAIARPIPAEPAARWAVAGAGAPRTHLDHRVWDQFVKHYRQMGPDGIARLRYAAVSATDRSALIGYLAQLGSVQPGQWPATEQLAFWVNLFNATIVAQVLEAGPRPTLDEIRPDRRFGTSLMAAPLLNVDGTALSLNDIRDHILRPLWREPQVIYLLACGALGCPDLPAEAATAANVGRLMATNVDNFINGPRLGTMQGGRLRLSAFYDWFGADFGGPDGLARHLRSHADPSLAAVLAGPPPEPDEVFDNRLNAAP